MQPDGPTAWSTQRTYFILHPYVGIIQIRFSGMISAKVVLRHPVHVLCIDSKFY